MVEKDFEFGQKQKMMTDNGIPSQFAHAGGLMDSTLYTRI